MSRPYKDVQHRDSDEKWVCTDSDGKEWVGDTWYLAWRACQYSDERFGTSASLTNEATEELHRIVAFEKTLKPAESE